MANQIPSLATECCIQMDHLFQIAKCPAYYCIKTLSGVVVFGATLYYFDIL